MPTLTEIQQLANSGFMTDVILNGVKGNKFGGVLFLPYIGYWPQSNIVHVESGERGLFWSTPGTAMIFSPGYNIVGYTGWNEFPQNGYTIRCVRNI